MDRNKIKIISYGWLVIQASLLLGVFMFAAISTKAEIPQTINYQSRLRTKDGIAVTSPTVIRFSLYTSLTAGVYSENPGAQGPLLWSELHDGSSAACGKILPDEEGYFSVQLGSCRAFPEYMNFSNPLFLGVTVESDTEAVPRVLLAAFPYAFNAATVNGLRATSTPLAGQLLALDANLNFDINTGSFMGASFHAASTTAHSSVAGFLGVGTTSSPSVLTIQGSGNANALSVLGSNGSEILTVTSQGKVGIGSTSPDAMLTVAGNIQVSGSTIFNGISYTWPAGQGGPGTFLANDGNGLLTWSTVDASGTIMPAMGEGGSVPYFTGSGYSLTPSGARNQLLVSQGASSTPLFLNLRSLLTDGGNISISGSTTATISVVDSPSFTSVNGISLRSIADGFTLSGGTQGRTLTVTGGDLSVNGNGFLLQLLGNVTLSQDLATTSSPTFGSLSLHNPLAVTSGGTGSSSFTAGGILYGAGEGSVLVTNAPSAGQFLVGMASSTPGFVAMSGDASVDQTGLFTLSPSGVTAGTYGSGSETIIVTVDAKGRVTSATTAPISGVAPGGNAGGDLSGTYPNPTVAGIGGWGLGDVTPTDGNLLVGSGPIWVSRMLFGDARLDSNGRLDLATTTVTAGRYGNATTVPYFTVDNKGRITSAGQNAIVIDPSQLSRTLPVAYGGTGSTNLQGVLKGNGTSSFTSLTGATSTVARWIDAYTLGTGSMYDTGSAVGIGVMPSVFSLEVQGGAGPSADDAYSFGSNSRRWSDIYAVNMNVSSIYSPGGQFYLNSLGKLGLGTTTLSHRLNVEGNINFKGALMPENIAGNSGDVLVSQGANQSPVWQNLNTALSSSMVLHGGNSFGSNLSVGTLDNYAMSLKTNGSERMRIAAGGNVGIGTQTPNSFRLQVAGNVGPSSGSTYDLGSASIPWSNVYADSVNANSLKGSIYPTGFVKGPLAFGGVSGILTQDSQLWWDASNRRLGVGLSTPEQALSVSGNVYLSGAFMPGGSAGNSGEALVSQGPGLAPVWQDINLVLNSSAILRGGNNYGTTTVIGTQDNFPFVLQTNGLSRLSIAQNGNVGVGVSDPALFSLQVAGNVGPHLDATYNLGSAARRWGSVYASAVSANTVSGDISPTGFTQGRLVFGGASGLLSQTSGLYWDSGSSKFGVGTTTPAEKLSVAGNFFLSGAFMPGGNAGTSGNVLVSSGSGLAPVWQDLNNVLDSSVVLHGGNAFGSTMIVGTSDNHALAFQTNGSPRMYVSSNGYVGIGTSTPDAPLHVFSSGWNAVFGNTAGQIKISSSAITAYQNGSVSQLSIGGPLSVSGSLNVAELGTGIVRSDSEGNITSSQVDLSSEDITGVLSANHGGLGFSSFAPNGILYANSSSSLAVITSGTSGQILIAGSDRVPRFSSLSGDASLTGSGAFMLANTSVTPGTYGSVTHIPAITVDSKGRITDATSTLLTGVPPGGVASGDLSGFYPEPLVRRINGALLGLTSPTAGNILIGNGSSWETRYLSGDASLSASGELILGNTTVVAGTYGGEATVPTFTVDGKGRITSVAASPVQLSASSVTSGMLSVSRGGTGASSLLGIVKGNGTSSLSSLTGLQHAVARWTDAYTLGTGTLFDTGSAVSVGSSATPSLFNVGLNNEFQVSSSGDVTKIKGITYQWPTSQGLNHTYLRNDGNGNLSWVSASGGTSPVNNGLAGRFAYYGADGGTVSDQSSLFLYGSSIGIGTSAPASTLGVGGTLSVSGTSTLSSLLTSSLNVSGNSTLTNLSVSGTSSLASVAAQTINVSGSSNLASLSVSGAGSFSSLTSQLLAVTGTTTLNNLAYTWPSIQGTSGQVLTNNGSGVLSWATPSSGGSGSGSSVWATSTNSIYAATGSENVGIGTSTPNEKLVVAGNIVPASTQAHNLGSTTINTVADFMKNGTGTEYLGHSSVFTDFNADGYMDALVSAHYYNGGQGAVYVYYGGANPNTVVDLTLGVSSPENFGSKIATGDINGDGYQDIVVGAYNYYNSSQQGRVYVFYGGPNPNNVADITITGETANNMFGMDVSSADVNGDGISDIIAGAYGYNSYQGRVYVFYGSRNMASSIAAASANIVITGEAQSTYFGSSVKGAGDFNGDGYKDFIVGAQGYSSSLGRAYVFFGGKNIPATISAASANVTLTNSDVSSNFGYSLSSLDYNGDGYYDVIIGAHGYNTSQGRVSIFYGSKNMASSISASAASVTLLGESTSNLFGMATNAAGDINGDGYHDLIVGSQNKGMAYIFYGSQNPATSVSASLAPVKINAGDTYIGFSSSLANPGDFNGDGSDDLLIGAQGYSSNTGRFYIYYGSTRRWQGSFVQSLNATRGLNIAGLILDAYGIQAPQQFGITTPFWTITKNGSAQFVDGNFSGVLSANAIALSQLSVGTTSTSSLFTLQSSSSANLLSLASSTGASLLVVTSQGKVGIGTSIPVSTLSVAGTLAVTGTTTLNSLAYTWPSLQGTSGQVLTNNGSGILSWSTPSSGGSGSGSSVWATSTNSIYAATGSENVGIGTSTPSEKLTVAGNVVPGGNTAYSLGSGALGSVASLSKASAQTERLGGSMANAGDVNGDGYDDLLVGAYGYAGFQGRVLLFYGGPSADNVEDVIFTGEAGNNYFGITVSAGDFNRDGYSDVVVGSHNYNSSTGRVYIFYGGSSLASSISATSANIILNGEAASSNFGRSLKVSDLNKDGRDDIVIGAQGYSSSTGRVYVFYGSASMAATITAGSANVILTGEAASNLFGAFIETGDVNGDGMNDIVIGAHAYDSSTGRVYVFYGKRNLPSSLSASGANVALTGPTTVTSFGTYVSTKDLNGDGLDDLLIGAPNYGSSTGRAYVFYGSRNLPATITAAAANITLFGEASSYFGSYISAFDVNSDGYQDIVASALSYNSSAGRVYVFYGNNNMATTTTASSAHVLLNGETADSNFGMSVTGLDMNGDGYQDIAIGAYGYSLNKGKFYVYNSSGLRWKTGFVQNINATKNLNLAGVILDSFGIQSPRLFGINTPAWSVTEYGSAQFTDGIFINNLSVGTTSTSSLLTLSGGAYSDGATWSNASDENLKENFASVSPASILEKINGLSIKQWNYKGQDQGFTHIGPTAQDFFKTFGLGGSDTSISTVDPSGVALLGIQALSEQVKNLQGSLGGNASTGNLAVTQPAVYEMTLTVKSHLYLSDDSVGEAKILSGSTEVRITFKEKYQYQPVVVISPRGESALNEDFRYAVADKNEEGFTIKISKKLAVDVEFDWHAFASESAKLTVSDGTTENIVLVVVPKPEPAAPAADDSSPAPEPSNASSSVQPPATPTPGNAGDPAPVAEAESALIPDAPAEQPAAETPPAPEVQTESVPPAVEQLSPESSTSGGDESGA